MGAFRLHLIQYRVWAVWLIAGALLMNIAMPAGFMPVASAGSVILQPCSGHGPEFMNMPGMDHRSGKPDRNGKDRMPCGFSGNAAPSLTLANSAPALVATTPVVASSFRIFVTAAIGTPAFLRPPLRGPPAAP